jgi:hypothetical protein
MNIINLTQHQATPEQIKAGVIDLTGNALDTLKFNLTFISMPDKKGIVERAQRIAALAEAHGFKRAMIGGAPYLMSSLEEALKSNDITPVYAFSERISKEETLPDGTIRKINIFQHRGFIEV